ncbi:MAG: GAF domain-containing protein [Anaerolineae bacterium]|nr:GAF domain-containing protein [Anaerolineae bacterium]
MLHVDPQEQQQVSSPHETALKSQFFELSMDLFCILNMAGRIETANPALTAILSAHSDQFIQHPFIEFVHEEDRSTVPDALSDLESIDTPISFVCRFRGFDETVRWYLWTLYPRLSGLIHAVGKDITPYKEMEAKESERNIFAEALLDIVFAINSSLALDQVLERILSNIGKAVAYEYVSILLVEADEAEVVGMQNKSTATKGDELQGTRFAIQDDEYLRRMFHSHESIIVPELERPPAWMVTTDKLETGAFLGSPIVVEGNVIGFVCVFSSKKEFFTPLHAQQLITFANQAGIAINNARLYEQAQSVATLRERQRMAQELHDAVNQDLFAASTYADLLPKAIRNKPDIVAQYATRISTLIRGAVDQMRMILIELHPDTLTNTGLEMLIQQLCIVFSRKTGIPVDFKTNTQIVLNEQAQIVVYRIAQEGLHNIAKHARATHVKVSLLQSNHLLSLIIKDNGVGFDSNIIKEVQFGIRNMRERARSINADFCIKSESGQGTKIYLRTKNNDATKSNPPDDSR